jgi:hypothetical protein
MNLHIFVNFAVFGIGSATHHASLLANIGNASSCRTKREGSSTIIHSQKRNTRGPTLNGVFTSFAGMVVGGGEGAYLCCEHMSYVALAWLGV